MSSNIPQKMPLSGIPKPAGSSSTGSEPQKGIPTKGPTTSQSSVNQPVIKKTLPRQKSSIETRNVVDRPKVGAAPPNWSELETRYKQEIEALTESAEMATIEKEIAEEKLDNKERELQSLKDKYAEASIQIDMLKRDQQQADQSIGAVSSDSNVTVLQLQKVEKQNELLTQALLKLRDISTKDKKALEDLQIEHEELQEKMLDLEEKEQKYLEQIKIFGEQIDVNQSAQEMVEKLTQQKSDLEDRLRIVEEDLDCMEKLRDLNEQILENARTNEIELTDELDQLRSKYSELNIKKRDMEDYLADQERSMIKLKDENRILTEQVIKLRDQFKEGESIEQQRHQIENVAYKLNFSESKMAERDAEIARCKRNLAEVEEQMNNLSLITKEQSARIDDLKLQNDAKTSEISELQRALKKKMDEVGELEIRREMAEKKLQSLQRDSESKISSLTRVIETMKGVEVQHEEDMKRLMEDNEIIERERRDLRDQLNKSNRSLERSMQAGNMSSSMLTAQDTSLASLGISFQASTTHQVSPVQQPQQIDANQISNIQSSPRSNTSVASLAGPAKHIQIGPDVDDSSLAAKIKDLSTAFDLINRKNYDLQIELALQKLDKRTPPLHSIGVSHCFDISRTKTLQNEILKLKREVRASMINQKICTKSRAINSLSRSERFDNSKLSYRYHVLESEANSLISTSTMARLSSKVPLFQSTPVK